MSAIMSDAAKIKDRHLRWSRVLNDLAPTFVPWRRSGAIITVGTDPCPDSPDTPAWYEPGKGDIHVNLDRVFPEGMHGGTDLRPWAYSGGDIKMDPVWSLVWGLLAHEAAHSRWTTWQPRDLFEKGERLDARVPQVALLFEEIRVEKRAVDTGQSGALHALRSSFVWLLKQLQDGELGLSPLSLGHTWALTYGRFIAGIASEDEVRPIDSVVRTALGDDVVDLMVEILEEASDTKTVRALRLGDLAREWLDLLDDGSDDGTTFTVILHTEGDGEGEGEGEGEGDEDSDDEGSGSSSSSSESDADGVQKPGSKSVPLDEELKEVVEAALAETERDITKHPVLPQNNAPLADVAKTTAKVFKKDVENNRSSSWRSDTPTVEQRAKAGRLSRVLERLSLPNVRLSKVPGELPPGRLRGREMVRQGAERARGMMSTATPWERTKRLRTHNKPVIVGVMTDTSGSMRWAQDFVAEFAWVMGTAGHRIGARCAAVTFGDRAEMVTRPGVVPTTVDTRNADGSAEDFDHAAAAIEGVLHLGASNNAAKVLFIISDGQLVNPDEMLKASKWLRHFAQGGTRIFWIGVDDTFREKTLLDLAKVDRKMVTFVRGSSPADYMANMEKAVITAAGSFS